MLRIAIEAGEGDDPAAGFGDERRAAASVGRDQRRTRDVGERRQAQEPVIAGFRGERLEELHAAPATSRSSARRRQTVDPSRTTTSIVATSFVMAASAER